MKAEGIKTKSISRHKYGILSGFVIFALIIFILVDYVFVIRESKVLAPEADDAIQTSVDPIESSDNSRFDKKTNNDSDTEEPNSGETSPSESTPSSEEPAETSSNNPDTYYNLAMINVKEKQYTQAIINFQKAIELNPKNPEYCTNWSKE